MPVHPYMNQTDRGTANSVSGVIGTAGADFKREFTLETYKRFFADAGIHGHKLRPVRGKDPLRGGGARKSTGNGRKLREKHVPEILRQSA